MLTLFLLLLSPPMSPSPRVEEPRVLEKQILREEVATLLVQLESIAAAYHAKEDRAEEEVKYFRGEFKSKLRLLIQKREQLEKLKKK